MAAVSNSSPLILYARIGHLDLLHKLFTEIFIPPAVRAEVVAEGAGRPGMTEVVASAWIKVRQLAEPAKVLRLLDDLDRGEAEAIVLAEEMEGQPMLLLDDRKARRLASARGLSVLGSAGMLALAKERSIISEVRPMLDALRLADLYLSEEIYLEVLAQSHELPGRA